MFGISNNKWHFILAVIAVALSFIWMDLSFSKIFIPVLGDGLTLVFFLAISILVAHHLQSWNEAMQAIDPKVVEKYTSYVGFQFNSRDDWKWFWRGIVVSWIIPLIYVVVK